MNTEEKNFIYLRTEQGTKKVLYNKGDMISSLPNKPPNYMIKMKNKVIEDQPLDNVQGNIIELTPTCKAGSEKIIP